MSLDRRGIHHTSPDIRMGVCNFMKELPHHTAERAEPRVHELRKRGYYED